jgi:hypothetical protein
MTDERKEPQDDILNCDTWDMDNKELHDLIGQLRERVRELETEVADLMEVLDASEELSSMVIQAKNQELDSTADIREKGIRNELTHTRNLCFRLSRKYNALREAVLNAQLTAHQLMMMPKDIKDEAMKRGADMMKEEYDDAVDSAATDVSKEAAQSNGRTNRCSRCGCGFERHTRTPPHGCQDCECTSYEQWDDAGDGGRYELRPEEKEESK